MAKVKIIQDEQKPHAVEIIADAIVEISKAMKKIDDSRISRDAIVTLIARQCGEPRSSIEKVLNCLDNLERRWLKNPVISMPSQPDQE